MEKNKIRNKKLIQLAGRRITQSNILNFSPGHFDRITAYIHNSIQYVLFDNSIKYIPYSSNLIHKILVDLSNNKVIYKPYNNYCLEDGNNIHIATEYDQKMIAKLCDMNLIKKPVPDYIEYIIIENEDTFEIQTLMETFGIFTIVKKTDFSIIKKYEAHWEP